MNRGVGVDDRLLDLGDSLAVRDPSAVQRRVDRKADCLERREQQLGLRTGELRLFGQRADGEKRLVADGFVAAHDQVVVGAADRGVAVAQPVRPARLEHRVAVLGFDDERVRPPPGIEIGLRDVADRRATQQPLQLSRRRPLGRRQRGADTVQQAGLLLYECVDFAARDRLGSAEAGRILDAADKLVERTSDAAPGTARSALAEPQIDLRKMRLHADEMSLVLPKPRAPGLAVLVAFVEQSERLVDVALGRVAALHAPDREVGLRTRSARPAIAHSHDHLSSSGSSA